MLRQRQKQTLFTTICSALIIVYRKQKVKQNSRLRQFDQNAAWFQTFGTLSTISVSMTVTRLEPQPLTL